MNAIYRVVGISKQSFHQYHNRMLRKMEEEEYLKVIIQKIRKNHPTMGCRDMYFKIHPERAGRDAFEAFCKREGYMLERKINYARTTDSRGVKRFENVAKGMEVNGANQLWMSDITYYALGERFYYLTFIIDVYTKSLVGHSVSKSLSTEQTTLPALKKAIKTREGQELKGLVLHSDGGGQYYDKEFLMLTEKYSIKNSMCKYPWENPNAERINGIIKNNYLKHREIITYEDLKREVDRSVQLYNHDKPHSGLNRMTPFEFEKCIFTQANNPTTRSQRRNGKSSQPAEYQPCGLIGKQSSDSNITPEWKKF